MATVTILRNLQEQVQKNKDDIQFILEEEGVLNQFGIKVVDQVVSESDVPTVAEYKEAHENWEYGDCIAIGTTPPYQLWVLTRANGNHASDYWFDIGDFPAPGPTGPTGPQGSVGPQGPQGIGFYGVTATLPAASDYTSGSFYILTNGDMYKTDGTQWTLQVNLKGPQGSAGTPGANVPVSANPSTTTQNLQGISIDGIGYKVDSGVSANPETTTATLNGITINGVSYSIASNVSEWEAAIKLYLIQNGVTTECGGNIYIDGMVETDNIVSATDVSGDKVDFVEFDPSDNHFHMMNTKVDDTLTIDGELEIGSGDLGQNFIDAIKNNALPSTEGMLNKWLKVASTGPMWVDFPFSIEDHSTYITLSANGSSYNLLVTNVYSITPTLTNVTASASNPTTIIQGGTATLVFNADSGYNLPDSVSVTGATANWTKATGVLVLSNPTGNVSFSIIGEPAIQPMPVKGQLITMNLGNGTPAAGTNNQYRVLSINGSVAEVVAMYDMSISQTFGEGNTYSGSDLDTYLNTTFYNSLSSTAKSAIVDKNITQYEYTFNSSVYNADTHASYADYSTKASKAVVGSRHVYALDVEDIETYFNYTFSTANIWTLFWNTTTPSTATYPWLRSASADDSLSAWRVGCDRGSVSNDLVICIDAARPALTIDLSKISWS